MERVTLLVNENEMPGFTPDQAIADVQHARSVLDTLEEQAVEAAIEMAGDNKERAAEYLGMSRHSLNRRLRKAAARKREKEEVWA